MITSASLIASGGPCAWRPAKTIRPGAGWRTRGRSKMSFSSFTKCWRDSQKRFLLWRLSRRLGIRLYPWQRDFALGVTNTLEYYSCRQSGRTTAVMLRILLMDKPDFDEAACILACDPDWAPQNMKRVTWYAQTYGHMLSYCRVRTVIPIYELRFHKNRIRKTQKWVRYPDCYRCPVCGDVHNYLHPLCMGCYSRLTGVWGES